MVTGTRPKPDPGGDVGNLATGVRTRIRAALRRRLPVRHRRVHQRVLRGRTPRAIKASPNRGCLTILLGGKGKVWCSESMTTPMQGEPALPEQVPLLTVESAAVAPTLAPRGASPTKVFRAWSPEQAVLLPASKRDHLGDDHLAVFLLDLLPTLDLSAIRDAYAEDRGQPPYDPRMLTALLLYAYSQRITSSRLIERRCREDVGFMYLTGDAQPDHDTICAFRRRHLDAFEALFLETLRVAQEAGALKLGRIALDGTKIRANASKHKAMSYARMPERQAALRAEVQRLLQEAEALDRAEDEQYGRGQRGDELPVELRDPATRRQRLREAKARLEAERKRELAATKQAHLDKIEAAQHALEAAAREQAVAQGQANPEAARPDPQAQRNFTDPESRIMKTADGFQQCYNAQVAATVGSQLIVAADVVTAANDKQQLQPMVAQVVTNVGEPDGVIADSGYFSEANVQALEQRDGRPIEAHIAVGRDRHGAPPPGPPRGRIPNGLSPAERMRRRLRTKAGHAIYAQRKITVEPVIGQIKGRGFRRFSLRGLTGVKGEFQLVCAVHNLVKLWRTGVAFVQEGRIGELAYA
jgi:transposase